MNSNTHSEQPFTLGEKGLAMEKIFSVPEGYFYDLEEKIISRVAVETFESSAILERLNTFTDSPSSPLPLNWEAGFKAPSENYFDTLSTRIFSKIERQESETEFLDPLLHEELKRTQFAIPNQYFETLSSRIIKGIENPDELLEKFNLEKSHPFQVPQDYFSNVSSNLGQKIENLTRPSQSIEKLIRSAPHGESDPGINHSGFKMVSIIRKRNFQWLAAACITILAIFSGIQIRNTYLDKVAYPILSQDDRLKYRFGIDESVIEDELVSDGMNESTKTPDEERNPSNSVNDQYLLSHPDTHTLLEEL